MKFKKSEKYASISVYAIITVLVSACIALVFFKFDVIKTLFSTLTSALAPITYGFVIAYLCNPLVRLFENKVFKFKNSKKERSKLKRGLSIVVTFLIVFALIAAFFVLLIPQIGESYDTLTTNMTGYISKAQDYITEKGVELRAFLDKHEMLAKIIDIDKISEDVNGFLSSFPEYIKTAANYLLNAILNLITELKNLLIGLIISIYMLFSKEKLCAQLKKLTASVTSRKTYLNIVSLMRYTDRAFGGFITGKILDSIIIGLVCFIVFGILGLNYYPLIAVVIAITNIIPIFGPFIGGGIVALILLIVQPSKLLLFIIVDIIIQQVDGNIIGPKVLGESIGLSGMWVMIAITVAGSLFGLPGMLLGVPTFAVIYSLLGELSANRLKKKNAPCRTDSYTNDPPEKDYLHSDIFIRRDEEIPENMGYPDETLPEPAKPKKSMWKKVEEKAVKSAKSKKNKNK
ncbi:MAG: AI-2E family transporter [Clostridia bacterium]|nr:AI-2E family transporter [Clostridia bacterium]